MNGLKKARNTCKITQSELAAAIGYEQSYISHVENGNHNPPEDVKQQIIKVLKRRARKQGSILSFADVFPEAK